MLSDVREKFTHRDTALAILLERPRRLQHLADVVELRRSHLGLNRLPMLLGQSGLGIKRIDLRRPAIHIEEDDVIRFGGVMEFGAGLGVQQISEGERAKAVSGTEEPVTTGKMRHK